jgi:hypothetical protein
MAKPLPMHQIKRIIEWQSQGKSEKASERLRDCPTSQEIQ